MLRGSSRRLKRRSDAECQRLDLLTRARDLLAEFYLVQDNGHGRELGKSQTRTGVNLQAKPLRA